MAKKQQRDYARIRIPVPLILLVVAGFCVWFFAIREPPEAPKDPHADIKTTPIDGPLQAFQLAWSTSDVGDIIKFEVVDEDDDETGFEKRAAPLGWLRDGLPEVISRAVEQTQKIRYTITWNLTGHEEPMVTYWEWTDVGWRIATWKMPKK
ncbi:MAG: hypothetical protein QNJ98_11755 [Planctomycetota bacterium]|nr:hypothetical protein [Planctomycetota bacterium]